MKFKRLFFDSSINLKAISKERFVLGLIIGLVSSFFLYSFFYVFREVFRMMSFGYEYIPNILSESDRSFYNLFFAGISLIFGHSIMLSFILGRPQKVFSRRNNKRQRLLTDQAFLNLSFLYWFGKISLVFGAFSMCCLDFNFLPYLYLPLILLIIVMYLDTWKVLLQVIGKKRYKYLLIHFFIFSFLSFVLSKVDVINYERLDAASQKNYYNVNLPNSNDTSKNRRYDYYNLSYTLESNSFGTLSVTNYKNKAVTINNIISELNGQKNNMRAEMIPGLAVNIFADSTTNLLSVKAFEECLYTIQQYRVNYVVFNEDSYSRRFEKKYVYNILNPDVVAFKNPKNNFYLELPPFPPSSIPQMDISFKYKNTLKVSIDNGIFIDQLKVPKNMLVRVLKNHVGKDIIIEYLISEKSSYQDYIWLLSSHRKAIKELRNENQKIKLKTDNFKYTNKKAFEAERDSLRKVFPFNKLEVYQH